VSSRVGFALSGQPLNTLDGRLSTPDGMTVAWPSAMVLATRDGGRHWRSSLSAPGGFWGVQFSDARHGWAVGVTSLYRTVDGGSRWRHIGEPAKALMRVAFRGATAGYGLTVQGRLVATSDGGMSWHASRWHGRGDALCVTGGEEFLIADQNAGLWRSRGGGWVRVAAGFARVRGFSPWWPDLSCEDKNAVALDLAYCEAACGGGVMSRSRQTLDDGRTWRTVGRQFGELAGLRGPPIIVHAAAFGDRGVCFVGYTTAAVVVKCRKANRAGRDALVPHLPFRGARTSIILQGIDFLGTTAGWLLIDQSTGAATPRQSRTQTQVWTTRDSGSSWQASYRGPTHTP
jgi:hypothetical protein